MVGPGGPQGRPLSNGAHGRRMRVGRDQGAGNRHGTRPVGVSLDHRHHLAAASGRAQNTQVVPDRLVVDYLLEPIGRRSQHAGDLGAGE